MLFRRLGGGKKWKYYVSNTGEKVPLKPMTQVSGCGWPGEELLEDGKIHLGMAD